jgi:hypothetical protein
MNASTAGALIGLVAALAVGWSLAGPTGNGAVLGYLTGAAFTGATLVWQRHELTHRPQRLFATAFTSFGLKCAVLLLAALYLRYSERAAQLFDWRSFLIAFAASAILIAIPGTIDNVRRLSSLRPRESTLP